MPTVDGSDHDKSLVEGPMPHPPTIIAQVEFESELIADDSKEGSDDKMSDSESTVSDDNDEDGVDDVRESVVAYVKEFRHFHRQRERTANALLVARMNRSIAAAERDCKDVLEKANRELYEDIATDNKVFLRALAINAEIKKTWEDNNMKDVEYRRQWPDMMTEVYTHIDTRNADREELLKNIGEEDVPPYLKHWVQRDDRAAEQAEMSRIARKTLALKSATIRLAEESVRHENTSTIVEEPVTIQGLLAIKDTEEVNSGCNREDGDASLLSDDSKDEDVITADGNSADNGVTTLETTSPACTDEQDTLGISTFESPMDSNSSLAGDSTGLTNAQDDDWVSDSRSAAQLDFQSIEVDENDEYAFLLDDAPLENNNNISDNDQGLASEEAKTTGSLEGDLPQGCRPAEHLGFQSVDLDEHDEYAFLFEGAILHTNVSDKDGLLSSEDPKTNNAPDGGLPNGNHFANQHTDLFEDVEYAFLFEDALLHTKATGKDGHLSTKDSQTTNALDGGLSHGCRSTELLDFQIIDLAEDAEYAFLFDDALLGTNTSDTDGHLSSNGGKTTSAPTGDAPRSAASAEPHVTQQTSLYGANEYDFLFDDSVISFGNTLFPPLGSQSGLEESFSFAECGGQLNAGNGGTYILPIEQHASIAPVQGFSPDFFQAPLQLSSGRTSASGGYVPGPRAMPFATPSTTGVGQQYDDSAVSSQARTSYEAMERSFATSRGETVWRAPKGITQTGRVSQAVTAYQEHTSLPKVDPQMGSGPAPSTKREAVLPDWSTPAATTPRTLTNAAPWTDGPAPNCAQGLSHPSQQHVHQARKYKPLLPRGQALQRAVPRSLQTSSLQNYMSSAPQQAIAQHNVAAAASHKRKATTQTPEAMGHTTRPTMMGEPPKRSRGRPPKPDHLLKGVRRRTSTAIMQMTPEQNGGRFTQGSLPPQQQRRNVGQVGGLSSVPSTPAVYYGVDQNASISLSASPTEILARQLQRRAR